MASLSNGDLIRRRLANQKLVGSTLSAPAEVVGWFGAMQAQEYAAARWALALRAPRLTDAQVQAAFDAGTILRTHVMRPTWHFVTPGDLRWLQTLTAPRVKALNAYYARKSGLDDKTIARSRVAIGRALRAGEPRTRAELAASLARAGIPAEGQRLAYVMMSAELDLMVCSGPRRGRQFTYALVDQRAPATAAMSRDEALAELTRRYFASHGPATLRDFTWWSGLTMADARRGVDIAGAAIVRETFEDGVCWSAPASSSRRAGGATTLLPIYDEYLIAYRDRRSAADPAIAGVKAPPIDGYAHWLVLNGRFAGVWRRADAAGTAEITVGPYRRLAMAERDAISRAVRRYGRFLAQPVTLKFNKPL